MKRTMTCWALLLLFPVPLAAQGFTLAPFGASDRGLPGSPTLAGLSATVWSGPFGLRVGGAMDAASTPVGPLLGHPATDEMQAWSADLDLVLSGGRAGLRVGGVEPGVFVGFGMHGRRDPMGQTATIPAWSYGATAGIPVTSWLEATGEARYRMPHESDRDALPPGVEGGLELRAGLAVHIGRRRRPARSATARPAGLPATIHIGSGGPSDAGAPRRVPRRSASAADISASTIATGDQYVGVPYVWGGATPSQGFDCSGFVQYVYARNGVHLPRISRDQARAGSPLPARLSAVAPGDLLFFAGADGVVDHVAIYVGDQTILHASGSRGAVGYDRLDSRRGSWYRTHLVAARRVIH